MTQTKGPLTISFTCNQCQGRGEVVTTPCQNCSGAGKVKVEKLIQLKIPPGVATGSRLRLRGEGEEGEPGGQNGDLYVLIDVAKHDLFARQGNDIYCRVSITFMQAALGDTVEIPTLKGLEKLVIPPGTQTSSIFRLPGKGILDLRGYGRGDQIIETVVSVPTDLTKRQAELLREFKKAGEGQAPS